MKSAIAWLAGVLCAMYLMNPTGGTIELLPDNLSLVGNLDELAACTIFLSSLRHFGVHVVRFFQGPAGEKG